MVKLESGRWRNEGEMMKSMMKISFHDLERNKHAKKKKVELH